MKIIDYVVPQVSLFPTEFGLVFGTRHGVDKFAADIFSLYTDGYFKNLLISGGVTGQDKEPEAAILYQKLLSRGIPERVMLIEDKAINTGQNVVFSRKKIRHLDIRALLLIGKISSKRRYMMTVRKQWPEIRKICCHGVNYFSCSVEQWWKDRELRTRVISEYRKIPSYIEKGFISEISIVDGVVGEPDAVYSSELAEGTAGTPISVSIKGILFKDNSRAEVLLLRNDREEWELPGGRIETDETPEACLTREFKEETGLEITAGPCVCTAILTISPPHVHRATAVLIRAYGCRISAVATSPDREVTISSEHQEWKWVSVANLHDMPDVPELYKQSIFSWAHRITGSENS